MIAPDSCHSRLPFAPEADALDWSRVDERERAARLAEGRIANSLQGTLALQTDPALANARKGF